MRKIVIDIPIVAAIKGIKLKRTRKERPYMLSGKTVKIDLPVGKLYITINFDENGNAFEVFLNLGKSGSEEKAFAEAIGRLISLYLQRGGDIRDIIKALKDIKGAYVVWKEGKPLYSVPDAVAKVLEELLKEKPYEHKRFSLCPNCNQISLAFESGCYLCKNCGYTRCG